MENKPTKIIVSIIGVFMIAVIIYNFAIKNDSLPDSNLWNKSGVQESNVETEGKKEDGNEDIQKQALDIKMGVETSTNDLIYKINSVTKTKQRGPLPLTDFFSDFLTIDNEGTILNDYSYLIVNLSIANNLEQEKLISLNSYYLLGKDSNGEYIDKFEPMLIDNRTDVEKRDYFHYTFHPKESATFNLGFILKDEVLDTYKNKMDLIIDNSGGNRMLENKDVRIIKILY